MAKRLLSLSVVFLLVIATLLGCASSNESANSSSNGEEDRSKGEAKKEKNGGVVNVYTSRAYETDQELYKLFEKQTGIKVNVVEGKGDELMERLKIEGEATEADVFITADAGNLYVAKESGLLQPIESETIFNNIPDKYRDDENYWFGITKRARVIVYAKDRVNPSDLSTYEALTDDKWKGKIVVRSSENMYNISLLSSFIEVMGEEKATEWAQGIVNNMARDPQGNDRDQAKAVVAGEADLAIMNTYYIGLMLNSNDPEEVKVGKSVGIFFPNQETTGTHINVSAAAVTKYAKNVENAIKFIEFLTSEQAQGKFAAVNYEYPVNPNVEPSELLKSWGEFKEQDIDLTVLGKNQQQAIRIFNQVGWK
ncbi:iron(III) transport system substrate-binding protein [Anoxybacillus tepidamans]|uniref:Iron(III) transport system substrate-binding protein n=1 Tax=Anoxybacteroides tepidamans TaxID=265948 RepID=A0A7W8IT32_9BACL|nr:Fe(3+) ABC transporter substrate-binding protein [Anoxybacillus tepidamans]MBB5326193.1 iron(III) transport system substrate-binding protein [Anoxybacillus tepidamans]